MTCRCLGRAFVSALLLAATLTPRALAGDAQVMIVLDGSGSMWAKIEDKTRIEVAREAIRDLMSDWDPEIQVGLMAYGHRRKDDCADIATLEPVGTPRPQAIVAAVDALQPNGMTPLSEAVRRAAAELHFTEKRATVVLVSDGLETCKQDPCKVGTELAKTGVAFTAHVIGFAVTSTEEAGLRCLAKNTGGMYLTASSAASLRDALRQTVEQAKEEPQPVVEKPGAAKVQPPATVGAGARFAVRWEGPDSRGDYVTVVRAGAADNEYLDYTYTTAGSPLELTAPDQAGAYEVRYVFGASDVVLARAAVSVVAAAASIRGPATATAGQVLPVEWQGPGNDGDYIAIAAAGAPDNEYLDYTYTTAGSPLELTAPDEPGSYELRYVSGQSGRSLARAAITLGAATASVSGPASVRVAQRFSVAWQGPNNPGDYLTIVAAGAPDNEWASYAYTSAGSPAVLDAPQKAGAYEIRYVSGQSSKVLARAPVAVAN